MLDTGTQVLSKACRILSLSLVVSSCGLNQPYEEKVKSVLVDPASAEFRDVFERHGNWCGHVNSRNRMGGFNGFTRFMVVGDDNVRIEPDISSPSEAPDWTNFHNEWALRCVLEITAEEADSRAAKLYRR